LRDLRAQAALDRRAAAPERGRHPGREGLGTGLAERLDRVVAEQFFYDPAQLAG
jgi:hypothetical protein